jgi:hypothetical protein
VHVYEEQNVLLISKVFLVGFTGGVTQPQLRLSLCLLVLAHLQFLQDLLFMRVWPSSSCSWAACTCTPCPRSLLPQRCVCIFTIGDGRHHGSHCTILSISFHLHAPISSAMCSLCKSQLDPDPPSATRQHMHVSWPINSYCL